MIFVVGEEVRKNREGISEARTEHSIVAGIETNLNLIWVQQKNVKPTRSFATFSEPLPPALFYLPTNHALSQKWKFTYDFVLKAQVQEMDIVEQDRNTLMDKIKTVENQRDDLLRKGRIVESERNDFLRSNKLMEMQRDDLENRCTILQKTNTTLNSRVSCLDICDKVCWYA